MNRIALNRLGLSLLRSSATILIVLAAVLAAAWLWHYYERSPWTRDGRVRADVVRVTPDIGGLVTSVAVKDNQRVKAGDLLFVLDQPRYALALEQANASVAASQATMANARAAVASAQATLNLARSEATRDKALGDLVATEAHEQNLAKVQTAEASLQQAQAAVQQAAAAAQTATAARDTALLNLKRTRIVASVDGQVTNLDLHPGDFVGAGQQAMALIDFDSLRIEGYFEETKLKMICLGAPVTVKLMGEDRLLKGVVDSIAFGINDPTKADARNLLPNVEPNFSWVRLAQRIPVRVRLTEVPQGLSLISGRTATVTVEPQRVDAPRGSCRHA